MNHSPCPFAVATFQPSTFQLESNDVLTHFSSYRMALRLVTNFRYPVPQFCGSMMISTQSSVQVTGLSRFVTAALTLSSCSSNIRIPRYRPAPS